MKLKFNLKKGHFTRNASEYIARPYGMKSYDLKEIVNLMLERGSKINRKDSLAVLSRFFETMRAITASGGVIHTDIVRTNISIKGEFDSADDVFDKSRHEIRVSAVVTKMLKSVTTKIAPERIGLSEPTMRIRDVKDSVSGSVNDKITSGGVIQIGGNLIKIRGDHPDNGVYLVASDDTKIKMSTLIFNKPYLLIVMLPTLAPGVYYLQVITQHGGGKNTLKTPKVIAYGIPLTVV